MTSSSEEFFRDDSSVLSLQPCIFRRESYPSELKIGGSGSEINGAECSPRNVLLQHRTKKFKLLSLDNCLIPSLYNNQFVIKDYVRSSPSMPTAKVLRPFVVMDGSEIISKSCSFASCMPLEKRNCIENNSSFKQQGIVSVLPPLSEFRTSKQKSLELGNGGLASSRSQRPHRASSLQGFHERMLFFCLGFSVGALSTVHSNRKEVEILNKLLKDSQNLVQDLQEELEMKSSLTVMELSGDACKTGEPSNPIDSLPSQLQKLNLQPQYVDQCCKGHSCKAIHKIKSFSRIEAELEAELEKLELNMGKAELNSEYAYRTIHGDLRADMLDSNADSSSGSSTTQTCHGNYSVSPRELSLRLHEVVESRLVQRIHELETALHECQIELNALEAPSGPTNVRPSSRSNSYLGSASYYPSPTTVELDNDDEASLGHRPPCVIQ